jgi:hypothetical protein
MAVSLITAPQTLGLAHNKIVWVFDSTNVNKSGFRYIVDIYYAGTATKIIEQKIAPDVTTGYCTIDVGRLLANLLSENLDLTNTTWKTASELFTKYDIKVGEEYLNEVNYTASLVQNGSYVKITGTHTFIDGDQVSVTQDDGGVANPNVEGLHTVLSVTGTTDFTIDALWSQVTDATINGSVIYANYTKLVYRDLYTSSNNIAYRGCLPTKEFSTYNDDAYTNSIALTGKFLTKGSNITISTDSLIWLSLYSTATQTTAIKVFFQNDNGDLFSKATNTTTNRDVIQIAVGTGNLGTLTLVSGSGSLIKSDTQYYDVWTATSGNTRTSEVFRIYVNQRCNINEVDVLFMDKLGSWLSFPFTLRYDISGDVQRKEYKNIDNGFTTYHTEQRERYTLRSNWVDQTMANLFNEIISSPYVYLGIDGDYTFVRVTDNTYQTQQTKNKKLIQYTLNVEVALDIPTNG